MVHISAMLPRHSGWTVRPPRPIRSNLSQHILRRNVMFEGRRTRQSASLSSLDAIWLDPCQCWSCMPASSVDPLR